MKRSALLLVAFALTGCAVDTAAHGSLAQPSVSERAAENVVPTTTHGPPRTVILTDFSVPADMLNPEVTQASVQATVCRSGWTGTIRPASSYTTALKRRQIAAYGYEDRALGSYEEDHVVPLVLGGHPTAPANLFPQPHSSSVPDDSEETRLGRAVCRSMTTLADAQARMYGIKLAHGYRREASVAA